MARGMFCNKKKQERERKHLVEWDHLDFVFFSGFASSKKCDSDQEISCLPLVSAEPLNALLPRTLNCEALGAACHGLLWGQATSRCRHCSAHLESDMFRRL